MDVVVLGSGVAGLAAALHAGERGLRVLVVSKDAVDSGSTRLAQGGLAAVLDGAGDAGDSVERHAADTRTAGAGLCDAGAVRSVVSDAARAVADLRTRGAVFDTAGGVPARTREGGHSAFRVIHAGGDATGAEIERTLLAAATRERVPLLEGHVALDTLSTSSGAVTGVRVLNHDGVAGCVHAPCVLVATGGFGQLYQATSNPAGATGDGLALALRAGAMLADMEFVQFHPTVLYADAAHGTRPLVTEALRGEGATLCDATGHPVMAGAHPLGDLAPRDVVAAAVTRCMAAAPGGVDSHVYLDATAVHGFATRFPTVHRACAAAGVDPATEPIPVAPAAHFACGGIVTDTAARTSVPGLYAAGEAARTGLHGANRLASNSVLEGLVLGRRAAESMAADLGSGALAEPRNGRAPAAGRAPVAPVAPRRTVQQAMSRYAAIGRSADGLAAAAAALDLSAVDRELVDRRTVEDASLTLLARALLATARRREESRGCHVRTDYPDTDETAWRRSQHLRLSPSGQPVLGEATVLEAA